MLPHSEMCIVWNCRSLFLCKRLHSDPTCAVRLSIEPNSLKTQECRKLRDLSVTMTPGDHFGCGITL
jgi:hypothetical protein